MGNHPEILRSPKDMRTYRNALPSGRVGFVPTMGALHTGHAELLRRLRARCDRLVLSIFVNPTQFGPGEDLDRYPRTFEQDLQIARQQGVDAVYFPTPESMYPAGFSTYVEESSLSAPLCGVFRPGHFRGVTTVVLKLFQAVRPEIAYFGLKDAQQFFVLHRMARDLDLDVRVEGVATVREPDGLALSSRNRYLSPAERELAPRIYATLLELERKLGASTPQATAPALIEKARAQLESDGFKVQYLECRTLPDLAVPTQSLSPAQPYLIAIAAHLGTTRLIDNVILRPEKLANWGVQVHL